VPDLSEILALLPSREGYVLRDRVVRGFEDPVHESLPVRIRIAQWARDLSDDASEEQYRLLASSAAGDEEARLLALTQAAAADTGRLAADELEAWKNLPETLQAYIDDPGSHPGLPDDCTYPLTVAQLAVLTDETARSIRGWTEKRLLPDIRIGNTMVFHRAATLRAMRIARQDKIVRGVLAQVAQPDERSEELLALIGDVMKNSLAPSLTDSETRQTVREIGVQLGELGRTHALRDAA
jgi:hypothetical protein